MLYVMLWFFICLLIWTGEDFDLNVLQIAFFPITIPYFMGKSLIGLFNKLKIVSIPYSESQLALWKNNKLHWLLGIDMPKQKQ